MFYGYAAAYFSPNAFDAAYNDFEARVREDGGTDYAPTHTVDVINDCGKRSYSMLTIYSYS